MKNGKQSSDRQTNLEAVETKEAQGALEKYWKNLERLVEERTAELQKAKERLEAEIASRKALEEEVIKAQKLESLGVLAGGIAHDFNNALTAILNNIFTAKALIGRDGEAFRRLEAAEKASRSAAALTQQLLTFSRGGEPVKKSIDLKTVIKETIEFTLRGANVKGELRIAPDLHAVLADGGLISQALGNLLINASQAMPGGGTVKVSAKNVSLEDPKGDFVEISVEDHGVGIPKENLSRIFDPYFTTKKKGSGLGLATTYSIINKHGGWITVESEVGSGATFRIFLPTSKCGKSGVAEPVEVRHKASAACKWGCRVLLMEDEALIAEGTAFGLRALGYDVEIALDGEGAIELCKKALQAGKPFHAAVLDLTIPGGMGGLEALKKLRELDPKIKSIVTSGYSNMPIMSSYKDYGFDGVVAKPYEIEDVAEELHEAIEGGS